MQEDIPFINKNFADLNPLIVGVERCEPDHKFGPSARDYYLIHYVVSGTGVFYSSGGNYFVRPGEIFIIHPQEITTYQADHETPWHYIWIGFNGRLAHRFDSLTAPVLSYSSNTFFDLLECRNRQQMREEFAAAKLFEIVSNLFDNEGVETRYEKLAYDYIQANFMRQIKIEEIADLLKVNRRYLSRLFKTAYGISMQQLLMKSRLDRAALLLQDGVRVSQAASLVGYEDVFHFSKMFKKKFGIAPQFYKATEKLQHY